MPDDRRDRLTSTLQPFLADLYTTWSNDNPARLSAALAYYGMFSFAPMLYIALTVSGLFIDTLALADHLFKMLAATLGQETADFIQSMVIGASQRTSGGTTLNALISLVVLLYAATGLFAHLKYSLNTIWQVPPASGWGIIDFIKTRLLAFVLVIGIGLMLVLTTFFSVFISILTSFLNFGGEIVAGNVAGFIALTSLAFAILYRILPDVEVQWRDVWPAALIMAVLFAIGRWGVGFYLSHSSIGSAFEAAGALAIVLMAIYYAAQLFLFGAIFSKVFALHFGSRRLK